MEMYFSIWTFVMFTFTIFIAILGFGLMQRSMNQILRQMNRQMDRQEEVWQRQEAVWQRQEAVWQRLFAKADNTERLTQEILTRLAPRDAMH
jgi:predicted Holliday junction resolvase-like endonuclease